MKAFLVNYAENCILFEFAIFAVTLFSLNFYTGSVKKLDLIIEDIRKNGEPSFDVILFDKFFRSKNLDPTRMTIITHVFFRIPNIKEEPNLYNNAYFIKQLNIVQIYRRIYKYVFAFWILNLIAIICILFFLR